MGQKVEYKQELRATSDESTNVDIVDVKVPKGYKRTIQHVACEDETEDYIYLRIGYLRDSTYHWWEEQKSPKAATLYWMDEPKVLQEDDVLVCRFNGTTDEDKLVAYVDGYTEKVQ